MHETKKFIKEELNKELYLEAGKPSTADTIAKMKRLIDEGADINAIYYPIKYVGETPLIKALKSKGTNLTIDFLINSGANVNMSDTNGSTPLNITIHLGGDSSLLVDRANKLIKAGAMVNNTQNIAGYTPLMAAAGLYDLGKARIFLTFSFYFTLMDEKRKDPFYTFSLFVLY